MAFAEDEDDLGVVVFRRWHIEAGKDGTFFLQICAIVFEVGEFDELNDAVIEMGILDVDLFQKFVDAVDETRLVNAGVIAFHALDERQEFV